MRCPFYIPSGAQSIDQRCVVLLGANGRFFFLTRLASHARLRVCVLACLLACLLAVGEQQDGCQDVGSERSADEEWALMDFGEE